MGVYLPLRHQMGYIGVTSYNPLTNLLILTSSNIQVVGHPLHGWHLSSCLGSALAKTSPETLHPQNAFQGDPLGDGVICLAGMNRSCFSGNKLSTSPQTEKKASFLSTSRTVTEHSQKKLETCAHLRPVLLTGGSFSHFYGPWKHRRKCGHLPMVSHKDVITSPQRAFWH